MNEPVKFSIFFITRKTRHKLDFCYPNPSLSEGSGKSFVKTKVAPPRLKGQKVGLFSTRSPHRPNPIGLTLTKLVKIEGTKVFVQGLDLIDKTPILDIKPYIPNYDIPKEIQGIQYGLRTF